MITEYEKIQHDIRVLEAQSRELKRGHVWGEWENWRRFTYIDMEVNNLKIELLEKHNRLLKESLDAYKDY